MNSKHYLTWDDVFARLSVIDKKENTVYGIPKGGMLVSAFLINAQITHNPNQANIILDDIIDSGKTMSIYRSKYPGKVYFGLIDKTIETEGSDILKNTWFVFPWEMEHPGGEENVQQNIVRILQYIGEDVTREGLIDTPQRVVRSWGKLFEGYSKKPKDILTVFDANGYDQIILLKDIELYSTCEHHMLPFYGKAHVAYVPNEKIVGISKLARLVDIFARRLQIQERIGDQVTDVLMNLLNAKGAACIIEAKHMCMCMRGVEKQNSVMSTSSLKGVFMDNGFARNELMQLIKL